jgi:hypothetical protein
MFGFGSKTQPQDETLRLEQFDTNIRGHRTLVVGPPESWLARLAVLESEALYKGKTVLVIQETQKGTGREWPSLMRRRWDVVFRVKESFDAQMLATYVQNAGKPCRVVWVFPHGNHGMCELPRALWQRWANTDVTLLGCTESGVIGGVEWQTILFPLRCEAEVAERILASRGTGISQLVTNIKEHLADIAFSGAAVAWTNINEPDTKGSLYWYDPSEGVGVGETYTKQEAVAVLDSLKKWLES